LNSRILIGNELGRRTVPRCPPSGPDEDRALDVARRFMLDEAPELVELGRAKARTIADSPSFVDLIGPVSDALIALHRLSIASSRHGGCPRRRRRLRDADGTGTWTQSRRLRGRLAAERDTARAMSKENVEVVLGDVGGKRGGGASRIRSVERGEHGRLS
jgi:hypothetical protein